MDLFTGSHVIQSWTLFTLLKTMGRETPGITYLPPLATLSVLLLQSYSGKDSVRVSSTPHISFVSAIKRAVY